MILRCVFLLLILPLPALAQKLQKLADLPESMREISGLAFLNDTVLVGHNDSGNMPILYFLTLSGKKFHEVEVTNAKNHDWEDITTDQKGFLYIGDIGNNNNSRKNLHIYKVPVKDILSQKQVAAEVIEFSYADQKAFPPDDKNLHYDAEALSYLDDSLLIFTKCRTNPFDGRSFCYKVPVNPGKYTLTKYSEIYTGKGGFLKDAVTGSSICGEFCYLLTYNRMNIYKIRNGKFELQRKVFLKPYTQKESITTKDNKIIYIADEKHWLLGGGNLYKIRIDGK